jgi:uncharacterized protein YecT (DUF1311 family)
MLGSPRSKAGMAVRGMVLLAGAVLFAVVPAAAKPRNIYQSCLDHSGGIDPVMKRCGADEIVRQDKVLNAVTTKLRAKLKPPLRPSLRATERAWLAYRDAQCRFAYDQGAPGTMAGLLYQSCVIDLTAERIKVLRESLDQAALSGE